MCSKATCRSCGKTTWSGCGKHVEQVMRGVPVDRQCTCGSKPAGAAQPGSGTTAGRLKSLFRRS